MLSGPKRVDLEPKGIRGVSTSCLRDLKEVIGLKVLKSLKSLKLESLDFLKFQLLMVLPKFLTKFVVLKKVFSVFELFPVLGKVFLTLLRAMNPVFDDSTVEHL